MKLTKQTNYAIRMMMYCASADGLSRVNEIASFYDLSDQFLTKIVQVLTREGLLESVRGRNGGIRLARPAETIRISDIVRVTEDNFEMAECFEAGGTDCPLVTGCGLNQALNEALSAFFAVLDRYTLADLAGSERNLSVLVQLNAMKDLPISRPL